MANSNQPLEDLVTQVVQRSEWDATGKERQMVTAYFETPSGFTGQVKMALAEWSDPETRSRKVIEAAAALDWRLAEALEKSAKKEK